jgi:hypothetical protein
MSGSYAPMDGFDQSEIDYIAAMWRTSMSNYVPLPVDNSGFENTPYEFRSELDYNSSIPTLISSRSRDFYGQIREDETQTRNYSASDDHTWSHTSPSLDQSNSTVITRTLVMITFY